MLLELTKPLLRSTRPLLKSTKPLLRLTKPLLRSAKRFMRFTKRLLTPCPKEFTEAKRNSNDNSAQPAIHSYNREELL